MQPSSYSRLGRRRNSSRENPHDVKSEDGRKPSETGTQPNSLKRSSSGPSLTESDPSNSSQNFHGRQSIDPVASHSQTPHPGNNSENDATMEAGLAGNSGRERRNSGSWTGVNESDEDMEHMSRECEHPSPTNIEATQSLDESLNSSVLPNIYYRSYQGGFNSYSTPGTDLPNRVSSDEEMVKRRLKFFFMNPVEKWQAKKRFPWKLLVQIIKIFMCTTQLGMFASQRYSHVTYLWDTKVSFSHLFIKGWDTSREVPAYPPSNGPLAIYKIEHFFLFLDYSVDMFSTIEKTAIGAYKYDNINGTIRMPTFCYKEYRQGVQNDTIAIEDGFTEVCLDIPRSILNGTTKWSTKAFLSAKNAVLNFDLLLEATYSFSLKTLKLRSDFPFDTPECYSLEAVISFDNTDHDGQMLVELDLGAKVLDCPGAAPPSPTSAKLIFLRRTVNLCTVFICALSLIMCFRALIRAQQLKGDVNRCFLARFHRTLTRWEQFEFVNLWYVLICVNDVLICVGSIIKMGLEGQDYEGYLDKWNVCSLFLGTGNLFIWCGCLRYLGFFQTYNVLILTIKSCFPNVLRYSICILMVFAGYSLCGWLILGPYHIKFRSLSTTVECLYSLINGDDMFATFSSTIGKDALIWWFSRLYLYTFISLFIYVILSLFIAIITDAYDTIKRHYESGFPHNELKAFADECRDAPWSGVFLDSERTVQDVVNHLCCCCPSLRRNESPSAAEYEPIST